MVYKEDLNWMKGIGCYVWDTPEIIRAKKSAELLSDVSNHNNHFRKSFCVKCNLYYIIYMLLVESSLHFEESMNLSHIFPL